MWNKLLNIDRRFIYLIVFAVVLAPLIAQWRMPQRYTNPWTKALFDYIEALPPGTPVLVAFDYEPGTKPELHPMAVAVTRHVLRRDLRLITMTFMPGGVLLSQQVTGEVARELGKQYGVDYVNLGFKPGVIQVIQGMGENLKRVFAKDVTEQDTSLLPVLKGVHDYKNLGLIVDITGTGITGTWIAFAHQKYGAPVGAGVTSVVAVDLYPYLKTKQLVGLINGIGGASEYERLLEAPGQAVLAIPSVTSVHVLMVVLVIIGNIAYFATRRPRSVPASEPSPRLGEED